MSIPQLIGLSAIEIVGDFALKRFANEGGIHFLGLGVLGYVGVVSMLVVSLQGSSILMVNGGWDAISTLMESLAAYIFLGERYDSYQQYIGLIFIIMGLYLLKIPWKKAQDFHIPKL
jgi:multidrug transporter EmrE-like cation transporter